MHVHLIEIAELMGYAHPGTLRLNSLCVQCRWKRAILAKSFGVNPISVKNRRSYWRRLKELMICKILNSYCTIAEVGVLGSFHY